MRRAQGYAQIVDPDRPLVERDTASCCHCGAMMFVKPGTLSTTYLIFDEALWIWREEPGASCFYCMKPVCLACHAHGVCTPIERKLEQVERLARQGHTLILSSAP